MHTSFTHRILPLLLAGLYPGLILFSILFAFYPELKSRPWQDELASAMAIAGFSMLIIEFTLSGRFKTLSAPIGMDIVMRFHQLMGRILLIFILLHPFLYSLDYQSVPWDRDFSLSLRLGLISGASALSAWLLLAALVILAIMRQSLSWTYERWRFSHLLMAVSVIILSAVHIALSGRYTELTTLKYFWLAGLLLVSATLLHVYLLIPLQQRGQGYYIDSIEAIADRVWKLTLINAGKKLCYRAGQFAWLKFSGPLFSLEEHPFSISSHPAQQQLEFTIKEYGDFTSQLSQLTVGSAVYIDGPHGHFTTAGRHGRGIMLVAGGVGIAPVISILRDLAEHRETRPVILVNCNRDERQLIYTDELAQLKATLDLEVIQLLSCPSAGWQGRCGRITATVLKELLPDNYQQWLFFVCGPPPLMDCIENTLDSMRVPLRQVVTERFTYDAGSSSPRNRKILFTALLITGSIFFTISWFVR